MKKKEKHQRKVDIVVDIICDCCGNSCKVGEGIVDNDLRDDHGQPFYDFEYMELNANWGYNSGKDFQSWKAQVCEKCVDERFGFIKFEKSDYSKKLVAGR